MKRRVQPNKVAPLVIGRYRDAFGEVLEWLNRPVSKTGIFYVKINGLAVNHQKFSTCKNNNLADAL